MRVVSIDSAAESCGRIVGTRLASVYAPLVVASFGSGAERVDVRFVAPDGTKAFEAELATDRKARIAAGEQLLANNHVQASADARKALLAGRVDPRLLVTLGTLAGLIPIQLVAFDDPSPGASPDVPLRGAEIGAATAAGLPAMVTFLKAQQDQYAPAVAGITQIANGQHVVTVRYDEESGTSSVETESPAGALALDVQAGAAD